MHSLALQVFLNILYNAAAYADKEQGKVLVALERSGEEIVFSFENNGSPIPEEKQPLIFSKFPGAAGEGLGLFIVKMISSYLGWDVSFKSPAQGKIGAVFYVKIPVKILKIYLD